MTNATGTTKTLAQMTAEVDEYCAQKGWRQNGGVSFGEGMALLHSEASEALEAWRSWGLRDATKPTGGTLIDEPPPKVPPLPKPEGVGSELADCLIRLLDDCALYNVNLGQAIEGWAGLYGMSDRFGDNIDALHNLIAACSNGYALGEKLDPFFAAIYAFLVQLCDHYGIDLFAEYERKMAYNRSRPYRHGGRAI